RLQAQKRGAYHQIAGQVEGLLRLGLDHSAHFPFPFGSGQMAQIHFGQIQLCRRRDDLDRLPFDCSKGGAQRFVAPDNFFETLLQRQHIKPAFEVQAFGNVINRAARSQLIEEPEPLLGDRERGGAGALASRNDRVLDAARRPGFQPLLQQQLFGWREAGSGRRAVVYSHVVSWVTNSALVESCCASSSGSSSICAINASSIWAANSATVG